MSNDIADWLRNHAARRLEEERSDMGDFGSALISTSSIDRLRSAADEIDSLRSKLSAALERATLAEQLAEIGKRQFIEASSRLYEADLTLAGKVKECAALESRLDIATAALTESDRMSLHWKGRAETAESRLEALQKEREVLYEMAGEEYGYAETDRRLANVVERHDPVGELGSNGHGPVSKHE